MKTRDELLRRPERRDLLVSWMGLVGQYQDPVFLVNRYNEIITVNKPALRLIRQEKSKILGKKINVFEGTIIDLEEIDSKKEALENIGYFRCYSLLKIKKNKEYLTELTINRLPLRNDDYCYLYQFAIEEKRNIGDYKDVVKLKNEIYMNIAINEINKLERITNIPYRRILKLFILFEGITPKQYLNRMKLKKCKEMVGEGKYSFKEIAYELGFFDVSHLSNFFKEKTSLTLNEYKNSF